MKEKILNLGNLFGAICFSIVAIVFFFSVNKTYPFIAQIAALVVVFALCTFLCAFRNKKHLKKLFDAEPRKLYIACALIMLTVQLVLVIGINFMPRTDASHLDKICRNFVDGNDDLYYGLDIFHYNYLERYSNQWGIFLLQSLIYKISVFLTGGISINLLPLITVFLMQLSYFILYKITGLVFQSQKRRNVCIAMMTLCPVLYVYSCVFYTDTLSMPILLGAVYFALCAVKSTGKRSTALYILGAALCTSVGYYIKGNVGIIAVALFIYFAFKINYKRVLALVVATAVSFMLVGNAISSAMKAVGAVNDESIEKYSFPMVHWVMMGLNGRGGYNDEDFLYTFGIDGVEEKKEADILRIKERIEEYGFGGFLAHLGKKIQYTWYGGTYQSTVQFAFAEQDLFTDFFSKSYVYFTWCFLFQATMILLMLFSFIGGFIRKKTDRISAIRLMELGLFLFLLIWETRSRYMLNMLPLYFIIAADGAARFKEFLGIISKKRTKHVKTVAQ